jgi:hypothetical protein
MKCLSCDKVLSNAEATRKYFGTKEFLDLCNDCFSYIEDSIIVTDGKDSIEDAAGDEN